MFSTGLVKKLKMAKTDRSYSYVLQYVSNLSFFAIMAILFVSQLLVLLYGTFSPPSTQDKQVSALRCLKTENSSMSDLHAINKSNCKTYNFEEYRPSSLNKYKSNNEIVFPFQMPKPEENEMSVFYSHWQQNIIGFLHLDAAYRPGDEKDLVFDVNMDIKLAYANNGHTFYQGYHSLDVKHQVVCKLNKKMYTCEEIKLFYLSSFNYDHYMVDLKFRDESTELKRLTDVRLTVKNQNDFMSRLWLLLKTMVFLLGFAITVWIYKKWRESRTDSYIFYISLLQVLTLNLGLLLLPSEELLGLLSENIAKHVLIIRNNFFHTALIAYWVVFVGEHFLESKRKSVFSFWKTLSSITTICILNFISNLWFKGGEVISPYFSVTSSELGAFIFVNVKIFTALCGGFYYPLMSIMVWKYCMKNKRKLIPLSIKDYRTIKTIVRSMELIVVNTVICISAVMYNHIKQEKVKERAGIDTPILCLLFYTLWYFYSCIPMIYNTYFVENGSDDAGDGTHFIEDSTD